MRDRSDWMAAFAGTLAALAVPLAFVEPPAAAASAAAATACAVASVSAGTRRGGRTGRVDKLQSYATRERQLVIYDGETGLLANWYISLRLDEECQRAARYERAFSVLLLQPRSVEEDEVWAHQGMLADWLQRNTRHSDLAGHLGSGRFILLLTETSPDHAHIMLRRMRARVPEVATAMASFPDDGETAHDLLRHCEARFSGMIRSDELTAA